MKRLALPISMLSVLLLAACSPFQQQQQQQVQQQPEPEGEVLAEEKPEPSLPEEENVPAEEKLTADNSDEGNATEAPNQNNQEPELAPTQKEHICSGLLSCKLGLCPNGRKRKAAQEAATKETNSASPTPQPDVITPTAEQMAAAEQLLAEQPDEPAQTTHQKKTKLRKKTKHEVEEDYTAPAVTIENTSGIPGRSGMRQNGVAPMEESISSGENELPLPNAAERHGLRSPSLPNALPLNIDGKTNRNR